MPVQTLRPDNYDTVLQQLTDDVWCVACLCAAWCDICEEFRGGFDALAARRPDMLMLWIDIEDEADLVGGFDVENFPTLLMQRGDQVAFYGSVEPDANALQRLLAAIERNAERAAGPATAPAASSMAPASIGKATTAPLRPGDNMTAAVADGATPAAVQDTQPNLRRQLQRTLRQHTGS